MKTINLEISLDKINLPDAEKDKSPSEVCALTIKNICFQWFQQQKSTEEDRRKFYKICDVFEAVQKDTLSVDLEDDWMGFIRKVKREVALIPNDLIRRVEEKIDEVKDR
jgi:hypothetical protein